EVHFVISVYISRETTLLFEPVPAKHPQIQEVHVAVEVEVAYRWVEQRNVIQINVGSRSPQVEDQIGGEIRWLLHGKDVTVVRPVRGEKRRGDSAVVGERRNALRYLDNHVAGLVGPRVELE